MMNLPKKWRTSFRIQDRTLVIDFSKPRLAISSAVLGGGIRHTRVVINHQVDGGRGDPSQKPDTKFLDPPRYLKHIMTRVAGTRRGMALMTAVDLRYLVLKRVECKSLWVEGFFTVGISNATCAGEPVVNRKNFQTTQVPGTMNIILVTNACFPHSALVSAIGVATESKTAVMLEQGIPSWSGRLGATGTGTDAIVLVSGDGPALSYSGTHTKIGELIGRVVRKGISQGLARIQRAGLT